MSSAAQLFGWFPLVFSLENINIDDARGRLTTLSVRLSLPSLSLPLPPSYTHTLDAGRHATHRQIHSASASLSLLLHLCASIPPYSLSRCWTLAHCCVDTGKNKSSLLHQCVLSFSVSVCLFVGLFYWSETKD